MPTVFRPCIDLHSGKVKQIVGGSLNDKDESALRTNFVSSEPPSYYATLYKQNNLTGAHVIKLGPGNDEAALECLRAWPGGLQIGGGITAENAQAWIDAGADKVIVTSYLFPGAKFSLERLQSLCKAVGKERLVVDVSCRKRGSEWVIAMDKWQTLTDLTVNKESLDLLANYCSEFLVHAADVEGLCRGIDQDLVKGTEIKLYTILTAPYLLLLVSGQPFLRRMQVAHMEEIMGMLMGDWVYENSKQVARIDGVSLLTRTEKRKDRVEIGPEQLSMAAIEAEEITKSTGKTTRVIGWYHSHPHITVFPSHVDLRTQLSQQLMDDRFIGMIVSCFNTDSEYSNKVQVTCFQSRDTDSGCVHVKLPFYIVNENPMDSFTLPKLLEVSERIFDEQRQSFYRSIPKKYRKFDGEKVSKSHTGSNSTKNMSSGPWSGSPMSEYPPSNPFGRDINSQSPASLSATQLKGWDPEGDTIMIDAESESAVQARTGSPASLYRSNTEISEEIPVADLRTECIDADAMSLPDRMTWIRNSGVYVQSLASLMDNLVGPTLQTLVEREQYNLDMIESLKRQKQDLLRQLLQLHEVQRASNLVNLLDD
ncbi:Enzyme that catalyzes the fourth step in the histidine pathway [Actinomortierella wolfii]|nr:Enzyme that catalyzes the fourth step in the histidine pathway [Actinomortierella wolfii]